MKSNEDLSVSVVVPFYNRSRFLKRLLDSVAAQTLPADKVYIIDNGSSLEETLNAWHIIKAHSLVDICTFTSSIGKGNANFARNLGYELAKTTYVAFLDSDDWWNSEHLNHSLYCLRKTNKVGIYSGAIIHAKRKIIINKSADANIFSNPFEFLFSSSNYIAQTSSYVIDKQHLQYEILWDNNLKRAQDLDYFASVFLNSQGWCYSPHPYVNIDWKDGGTDPNSIDFSSLIYFYKKWNKDIPEKTKKRYLKGMLYFAFKINAPSDIKKFYLSQIREYKKFNDYGYQLKCSLPYILAYNKTISTLEATGLKHIVRDLLKVARKARKFYTQRKL